MNLFKIIKFSFIKTKDISNSLITFITLMKLVATITSQINNISDSSCSTCLNQLPPTSSNDCNKFNNDDFYCCFLTPLEGD